MLPVVAPLILGNLVDWPVLPLIGPFEYADPVTLVGTPLLMARMVVPSWMPPVDTVPDTRMPAFLGPDCTVAFAVFTFL